MGITNIEWTDYSFNIVWGCTKVSPGCDHCYAETWAKRTGYANLWGPEADRRTFGDRHWDQPLKWNDQALEQGRRRRVFCSSMADVFDNHDAVTMERIHLWDIVRRTPELDWLILTKRVGNVPRMLPPDWRDGYPNVWLGISVVNQEEANRDVPKLLQIPARIRFLSCEPLLGPIELFDFNATGGALRGPAAVISGGMTAGTPSDPPEAYDDSYPGIDWVICGGESGPKARPMEVIWADSLRAQCENTLVPFFFKQGSQANWPNFKDFESFPPELRVREWPEVA